MFKWSLPAGASATGPHSVSGTSSVCSGITQGLSGFSSTSGGSSTVAVATAASSISLEEEELQLRTLRVDVQTLLSSTESQALRNRAKYSQPVVGGKRERAHPGDSDESDPDAALPLSAYPWNQSLSVQDSHSLSMLGRMLRVALTFWNEHCGFCSITAVQFQYLHAEQAKLYSEFLQSAETGTGAAVCAAPSILLFARRRLKAAEVCAVQRSALYPNSAFLAHVKGGRAKQRLQLDAFMDKVTKRVSDQMNSAPASVRVQVATLMWQEFLGGWMPITYSATYCDELLAEWQRLQNGGVGALVVAGARTSASGGVSGSSPASGAVGGSGAATPPAGSGGAGSQSKADFPRIIPWSIDVVGVTLGVKSSNVCSTCKPGGRLHGGAECPKRWGKKGVALPGFHLDGTHDPAQWKGKEPIKSTIQAWITLLKDHSMWNNSAPVRSGVANAPSLADFERRLPAVPPKP